MMKEYSQRPIVDIFIGGVSSTRDRGTTVPTVKILATGTKETESGVNIVVPHRRMGKSEQMRVGERWDQ